MAGRVADYARRLVDAYDTGSLVEPITASDAGFDVEAAYEVSAEIEALRTARGWRAVGRKIGFTNTTIWPVYGVDRPMWASVYDATVHDAIDGRVTVSATGLLQPRVEPEVVFGLRGAVPLAGEDRELLEAVEWVAAGFELVQCPFPGWRFSVPDCTAAAGLHGALAVGPRVVLDDASRDRLAGVLATFEVDLLLGGSAVARGVGANVLGSPALALRFLAQVLESQPASRPLAAGEVVTTGTLTDAAPIEPGQVWRADYGKLGVPGFDLQIS